MKIYSLTEAKEKIKRYCAYQERAHLEVRNKLYDYGLNRNDLEEIMADLITEGFLNEERYAKAFAGGKFRMKKWGRVKITRALEAKGLNSNCIKAGLDEIDNEDYEATLAGLLRKKMDEINEGNVYVLRDQLSKAVILKGYEPELVWKCIRLLVPDQR